MIYSQGAQTNVDKDDDSTVTAEIDIWVNSPKWMQSLMADLFQPTSWEYIVAAIKEGSCVAVTWDLTIHLRMWLLLVG